MYPHIINSYYTDTDSIVLDKPLSPHLLGTRLGEFKQEYGKIVSAIFPGPKLYFLELENGKIVTKGKGYSGEISKYDYIQLFSGSSVKLIDTR